MKEASLKKNSRLYEYEIILCAFFILRFAFKNILKFKEYFIKQPIFGLSDSESIVLGTIVLAGVVMILVTAFGRFLKSCEADYEKSVILLVALFLACPATIPFLFDTESISGTQLLYPFALFVITLFIAGKPFVKWLVPFICAFYIIPSLHSSEIFFSALRKEAVLYVPLILWFLYLEMKKKSIETGNSKAESEKQSQVLLTAAAIASAGSYAYSYTRGYSWGDSFGAAAQKIDLYLLAGIIIVSPALITFAVVLGKAAKNSFPANILGVFWRSHILLFLLYWNNYTGLWVPFLLISLTMFLFYAIKAKNPATLTAVKSVGEYLLERRFIFYIILIAMASLSNVSSDYLSSAVKSIFSTLPY